MPKIYSYKKHLTEFTTITAVEPDNQDAEDRITELATIDGRTYISVPDSVTLPTQPKEITLVEAILSDVLKEKIKKASPHVQLINQRVRNKITKKYSITDEIKILRRRDIDALQFDEYDAYVEECIAWGDVEKAKLGIGKAIAKL